MPSAAQQAMDDPETRELFIETWPKKCSCGTTVTEDDWERMRYVGVQKVPHDMNLPDLELRNCPGCQSTMAIAVTGDFVEVQR